MPSARALPNCDPGATYDPLADAPRGGSRADWLVGMNLSRAYSLAYGEDLSVGRVQTPTKIGTSARSPRAKGGRTRTTVWLYSTMLSSVHSYGQSGALRESASMF